MLKLGVNIDHIATLRQARQGCTPEPILAALLCEQAGADSIVAHLREDRRHIQDRDIALLKKAIGSKFNLEMSTQKEIVDIACAISPDQATLVPERRRELTTEGGLNVQENLGQISRVVKKLQDHDIAVSLFIDPVKKQIDAAIKTGAGIIELHTGAYANSRGKNKLSRLSTLRQAADYAKGRNLIVCAGHGLDYDNVVPIARIKAIEELNIGHSIICRAVIAGITNAVKEMKELIS